MSVIVESPNELEPILKAEAGKAGVDATTFTHQLLRKSLEATQTSAPCLPEEEAELIRAISAGPSSEQLDRYRHLIGKRQRAVISPEELRILDEMTRQMESLQVQRLAHLARLAKLRGVDLPTIMRQLEIHPPDVL